MLGSGTFFRIGLEQSMIRPDTCTEKTLEAISCAQQLAATEQHQAVSPVHVLLCLLKQDDGVILPLYKRIGVNVPQLQRTLEAQSAKLPQVQGGDIYLSTSLKNIFAGAQGHADQLKDDYISTEHLLLAICDSDDPGNEVLRGHGVNSDSVLKALAQLRGSHRVTDQHPENRYQALSRYGRDLTLEARKGKTDPVIGRDQEVRRVLQVLADAPRTTPC